MGEALCGLPAATARDSAGLLRDVTEPRPTERSTTVNLRVRLAGGGREPRRPLRAASEPPIGFTAVRWCALERAGSSDREGGSGCHGRQLVQRTWYERAPRPPPAAL